MPDISRAEVQDLLPWWAAGSLGEADTQRVQAWLAAHAGPGAEGDEVRAELAWLRLTVAQNQAAVQQQLPPADQGLAALLQRVRSESAAAAAAGRGAALPGAVSPRPAPWQALWHWLRHPTPLRGLALAGLALGQAAVIVLLLQRPPGGAEQMPLSDPRLPSLRDGALLQVTFVPAATEAQVRAALQQAQASLVAGPGTLGVYTVVVPRASLVSAAAALRAQAGVVDSVQIVPAR